MPITAVAPTRQMAELVITQNTRALQDLHKSSVLQTLPYFDGSTNLGIRSWLHQLETMTSGWDGDRIETIIKLKLLNKAKAYSDRLFREYAINNPGRDLTFIDWKKSMITHFDKPVEEYQRLFHQARQETNDSVDDFVEKLSNLYKNGFETGNADYTQPVYVNIADEVKTRALLKGLSREITDILWLKINPTTSYKDIVKEAINVEKSLRMRRSYSVDHKITLIDSDLSNQMEQLYINYVDTNEQ